MNGLFVCAEVNHRGYQVAAMQCFLHVREFAFDSPMQTDPRSLAVETYRGEMCRNQRHGLGQLIAEDGRVLMYGARLAGSTPSN